MDRIGYSSRLFDIIRIDHFRAFDTFWKIPATCPTAIEGEWIEAPGYEVIDTLLEKIPEVLWQKIWEISDQKCWSSKNIIILKE